MTNNIEYIIPKLNSLKSMYNLGHQPKINNQCRQNLRFINQASENSSNRFRLRKSFGNKLFNLLPETSYYQYIIFLYQNSSFNFIENQAVKETQKISQFNQAECMFEFNFENLDIINGDLTDLSDLTIGYQPFLTQEFNENIDKIYLIKNLEEEPIEISNKLIETTGNRQSGYNIILKDDGCSESGLTPFRKAFNAGDIMNTNNLPTSSRLSKPPNQVNSLNNMFGWKSSSGSIRQDYDGSFYTGNPKFIYDSSDYVKFKKLQAINKNYNDITFGG